MSDKNLATALNELADREQEIEDTEKALEWHRLSKLMPHYEERDKIITKIPNFWKIVLSQHDDFANYVRASDFKYIDAIESLVVKWYSPKEFDIIIKFQPVEQELPAQTVRKHFRYSDDELKSEVVEIKHSLPPRKRRNRFFDWFLWQGLDDKSEFPNGDGLAQLLVDEIYPLCVKFYIEAQRDAADEEDDDDSEGELL